MLSANKTPDITPKQAITAALTVAVGYITFLGLIRLTIFLDYTINIMNN